MSVVIGGNSLESKELTFLQTRRYGFTINIKSKKLVKHTNYLILTHLKKVCMYTYTKKVKKKWLPPRVQNV